MNCNNRFITPWVITAIIMLNSLPVSGLSSIEELDEASEFHFSIMSDNKGEALNDPNVANWNEWARSSEFTLGVGDNLQHKGEPFIDFIREDDHWKSRFYPNIGDGENQHFSGSQGDWGSGWEMFNIWNDTPEDFFQRPGVTFRPVTGRDNDRLVDYRYDFTMGEFTVTSFQLHFSDTYDGSMDPAVIGLSMVTLDWLKEELTAIKEAGKSDYHIVIVLAQTDVWQEWVTLMPDDIKNLIITTADLAVGASTHMYGWRQKFQEYNEGNGVVMYNSGSCGAASSTQGYSELHVLDNPPRLVIQYMDTENNNTRQLHVGEHTGYKRYTGDPNASTEDQRGTAVIKTINGPFEAVNWDDIELPVGVIKPQTLRNDDLIISPFGVNRKIDLFLSEKSRVTLSLFDARGQFIKNITKKIIGAGNHTVNFNTSPYQSGVYYLQGSAGHNKLVKKVLVMR